MVKCVKCKAERSEAQIMYNGICRLCVGLHYAKCDDAECIQCGVYVCPQNDPLHFHYNGCPACGLLDRINKP